jgi:hypothetical protein
VDYDLDSDVGGDCSVGLVDPAREFLSRTLTPLAASAPPPLLADGDHYREMAGKVRELARTTRSPGMRRELVNLAKRYDRRRSFRPPRPLGNLSCAARQADLA